MAQTKTKRRIRGQKKVLTSPFKDYWTKENYYILGFGFLLLVIGNILLAQSPYTNPLSLSVAPVILLFAYLVVFPFAILYRKNKNNNSSENVSG